MCLNFWFLLFELAAYWSLMNWILSLFQTWIFCQATAGRKIQFKQVHQTWYFKMEKFKNQVQIDRGYSFGIWGLGIGGFHLNLLVIPCCLPVQFYRIGNLVQLIICKWLVQKEFNNSSASFQNLFVVVFTWNRM